MKIKEDTLEVLKNFSDINDGIWIEQGNILAITSKDKHILGIAEIEDVFPNSFGIYDLSKLLAIISMYKETPEIEYDEHHMIVSGLNGRSKIKYRFCSEDMIVTPPRKFKLKSEDISFTLNEEDYIWLSNAAKILQSPNIAINSDGENISLIAYDLKDDSAHNDTLKIDEPGNGAKYNIILDFTMWNKMYTGSYDVTISAKYLNDKVAMGAAKFVHRTRKLEYVILLNKESSYDNT